MRTIDLHGLKQEMHQVRQFICTNIRQFRTTAEIARHFDMSRSTLNRRWKRAGESTSLRSFIANIRCRAALAMHRSNPDALCKEAAASAGYRSPEAASRSFHHHSGESMHEAFLIERDTQR